MSDQTTQESKPEQILVDDFIDSIMYNDPPNVAYAKFVLMFFRMPAVYQSGFRHLTAGYKLYGNYQGRRVRVNVASRMGDIGITYDLEKINGYDERVDVSEVTDWSNHPDKPYSLAD